MNDFVVNHLPPGFSCKILECKNNICVIEIKELNDENSALDWLKQFSDLSKSTWRSARTYPKSGKYNLFKVDLRCVHFTDRRTRSKGKRSTKHTGCEAKLQIKVRRCKPDIDIVLNNRTHTSKKFPGLVTFRNEHNHPFTTPAALKHRDMDLEVKEKLCNLLSSGHSPSSALLVHKTDLMIKLKEGYFDVAADGKYVPRLTIVNNLLYKENNHGYISHERKDLFTNLEILIDNYNKNSDGKAIFKASKEHYFVVLVTPTMFRAHQRVPQSAEIVMLEASGGTNKQKHRIYFLVTLCAAGGIPLGVVITKKENETVLLEALETLKDLLKEDAFFKWQAPIVFMANDLKELNVLKRAFPQSVTLLCQFHILKSVWSWLCDTKHEVSPSHCQELYFLFKDVLYAQNEIDALTYYKKLKDSAEKKKYKKLIEYLEDLWAHKASWTAYYRKEFPIKGNNTTNYGEVVFRILRDCMFDGVMTFNITQIVDFVLNQYDHYLRERFVDFYNGQYNACLLKKMMPSPSEKVSFELKKDPIQDGVFIFSSENGVDHSVDILRGFCTCESSKSDKLCRHVYTAILSLEKEVFTPYNACNSQVKECIFFIAEGKEPSLPLNSFSSILPQTNDTGSEILITDTFTVSLDEQMEDELASTDEQMEDEQASTDEQLTTLQNTEVSQTPISSSLTGVEKEQLKQFLLRIPNGLKKNPELFIPAVRNLLKNCNQFASTENGFVNALNTFGSNNMPSQQVQLGKYATILVALPPLPRRP